MAYLVVLHETTVLDNPQFDHIIRLMKVMKKDKPGTPKNTTLNVASFLPPNTKDFIRFKSTSELTLKLS